MYNASRQFKNCMKSPLRNRAHIQISIGVINSLAQSNGEITSDLAPWSNERSIWKANTVGTQYATFEDNFFKADGSQYLLPEPDVDLASYNTNTGVVSEDILGSITITFNQQYDLKGLTVRFGEFYPTEFTVTVDGGTYTYTNDSEQFETSDTYGVTSSMIITPITMVGGQQRLRIEELIMGIGFAFTDDVVKNVSAKEDISFISSKISGHTFDMTAIDLDNNFNVDDVNSYINYLETGQRINVIVGLDLDDGTIEWVQQGVYYLTKWNKDGMNVKLTASDRLSFLTDTYSGGNYIHSRTLYDDCIALMQFANIDVDEYNIDDTLKQITVTNPLPSVQVKQALQLIANAGRCVCFEDRYGVIQMMANFSLVVDPEDIVVSSDSDTEYSHSQNITVGTTEVYADFTDNFFSADGSMYLLPESGNDYSRDTGFVSSEISDENGNFFDNIFELPYDSQIAGNPNSYNGLTFTANEDGSIHIQGTCTANTWYSFFNNNLRRYMSVDDCPWTKGDVLECDYYLEGTSKGNMGITCGYKTSDSSANQGYTNYRNLPCNFTDSKFVMSDKKVQTIDPKVDKEGMYWTSYIYIQSGCVCDVVLKPMLTVRKTLGNILAHNHYRLGYGGVNNTWTHQGVTYTFLDDGGILVNGTATAESVCELINPYNSSNRLTLEVGHTYKMSEGRDITTWHRNPFLQLVRYNATSGNYDYTYHTGNNGTIEFTQTNENLVTYGIRIVVASGATVDNVVLYPSLIDVDSYDENELNPTNYQYGNKPSLTLELPASFTYYGFNINFDGNAPQEMLMQTYNDNVLVSEVTIKDLQKDNYIPYSFKKFDKVVLTFTKGTPNNRVLINKFSFSDLSDYKLLYNDIIGNVKGIKEKNVKTVKVKRYTFTEPTTEGELPQQKNDDVWFDVSVLTTGDEVKITNQLISTEEHASLIAEWIKNYYLSNISYSCKFRGDPTLNATDIIYLDNDIINNLQVEIEKHTFTYNGAFGGSLEMRRTIRAE